MKFLKYPLWLLWRIWFYILVAAPIVLFFPLLLLSILKESWYPYFFKIARIWAKFILYGMGFYYFVQKEQELDIHKSYMLIANHTSMTDIMLMLAVVKNPFVFVGKKELANIPLFGFFYKRTSILVDRTNQKSRYEVYEQAQRRLKQGLSICIFPEGGVPDESVILDEFKDGAFRLAIDFQIPVVPMTFIGLKKMFPFRFFAGYPGKVLIYQHPFVETQGLTQRDKPELKEQVRELILKPLLKHEKNNSLYSASGRHTLPDRNTCIYEAASARQHIPDSRYHTQ